MAGSRGIKRSQQAEDVAEDRFLAQGRRVLAWVQARLVFLVGGIVLILGSVFLTQHARSVWQRGDSVVAVALHEAVQEYERTVDPATVLTATSADALRRAYDRSRARFADITEEHANHPAARIAAFYQADLERRAGRFADAEQSYRRYLTGARGGDVLKGLALEGLGYTLEALGRLDEALEAFEQMAASAGYLRDHAFKHRARILEHTGDKDGATVAYQSIVDMEPPSELRGFAETRLRALK